MNYFNIIFNFLPYFKFYYFMRLDIRVTFIFFIM